MWGFIEEKDSDLMKYEPNNIFIDVHKHTYIILVNQMFTEDK